jgi:hypothetical protein
MGLGEPLMALMALMASMSGYSAPGICSVQQLCQILYDSDCLRRAKSSLLVTRWAYFPHTASISARRSWVSDDIWTASGGCGRYYHLHMRN